MIVNREEISAKDFKQLIASGKSRLEENSEYVNSLNVFPVPDGDTGTNMNLTFTSGNQSVKESREDHVGELGKVLAKGLLMGARGNSGVILSQLFRGFSKAIEEEEVLTASTFAKAFDGGVKSAYKAVMKPVEGTVLTVARESAEAGMLKAEESNNIIEVMEAILEAAKKALKNTPNQLEVLKEVGVVDSGGQGLVYIYEGFLASLTGQAPVESDAEEEMNDLIRVEHHRSGVHDHMESEEIEFGYCTEIMVRIGEGETVDSEFDYDEFRNYLDTLGDSLLVVADEEIVKVHVHTETPGEVMNYGQKFGSLIKIKVDNMREQHSSLSGETRSQADQPKARQDYVVLSVSAGEGISKLFKGLGVEAIIQGGQTMNPSTEDIVKVMEANPAKNYIILPNNKNIFMAAKQATEIVDSNAEVVETRTVQQGFAALLAYNPERSLAENKQAMTEEMGNVKSGQVTTATRDTTINGLTIKKNDFIGLIEDEIKVSNTEVNEVLFKTIEQMIDDDSEIITVIYGEQIQDTAINEIATILNKKFSDVEIELHPGHQPVYPFLIAVE